MRSLAAQLRVLALCLSAVSVAPWAAAETAKAKPAAADRARAVEREADRLASWVSQAKGELSLLVVDAETGRTLAAHQPNRALNPASNAKVLTAATALSVLGPDRRFQWGLYGTVKDGFASRLVLRSNGDPSLDARALGKVAKRLVDDGLKRVGEVLVDQGAFDDKFVPPAFDQQPGEWAAFRAPVSAVSLDENSFVVRVEPGEEGKPAKVSVDPAGYVDIDASVTTEKKGKGRKLRIVMKPDGRALSAKLVGHVSAGDRSVSFRKRVHDPTLYAGFVLRAQLKGLGVTVDGGVAEGGKDETHALEELRSQPTSVLLAELGKRSDNFYAETFLKAIGAASTQKPGSSADGAKAVESYLNGIGASDSSTRIVNGSGLFDANRISAQTLVTVLQASKSSAFIDQLAVGGVDGTLKSRFRGTRGRIRAKTGTLARAHALSGFVLDSHKKPKVVFAILINGIAGKADEQRRRMDRVVEKARLGAD